MNMIRCGTWGLDWETREDLERALRELGQERSKDARRLRERVGELLREIGY